MNKTSNYNDKSSTNHKNPHNQFQNMMMNNQLSPINNKSKLEYDNTAEENILDEDRKNNDFTKVCCPFNFNTINNNIW